MEGVFIIDHMISAIITTYFYSSNYNKHKKDKDEWSRELIEENALLNVKEPNSR